VRESTIGAVLVLCAAAGFGTIGIFGKLAVAIDLDLATLLPVRFTIATLVVVALAITRGWAFPRSERAWLTTLALGVTYTAMTLCFFVSLRFLTAGIATIVLYTYPTFVVALSAIFLDELVTARKLIALGLATGGIALVVGVGITDIEPLGVGLALPTGSDEWWLVLGLALISTVVPHLLFYEGVARLQASRVGVVSTAEPVVTVVLGVLLLGETVTLSVLVGGVLVLGGVLVVQSEKPDPSPLPEAPAFTDPED
jgi:drug/metabolite transporter (DMT)-like permease